MAALIITGYTITVFGVVLALFYNDAAMIAAGVGCIIVAVTAVVESVRDTRNSALYLIAATNCTIWGWVGFAVGIFAISAGGAK